MRLLPKFNNNNPNVLVGLDTFDDAGVYRLSEDMALIQTVDYFTPIVDDPYMFGQIAAANALSDVYAMGGRPLTVLNIVGFPIKKLDKSILADILRGAKDKVEEAGAVILGGHSIDDQEPKFGMAVTGIAHPNEILTNCGAKPGDVLVLTKPIGVGILTTAIKRDMLPEEEIKMVTGLMAELNKNAVVAMNGLDIHACTDVTGFGLLGHAREMAAGSNVGMEIWYKQVPVLSKTEELAHQGAVPGGSKSNHAWLQPFVSYEEISEVHQIILCDAITSGGLLVSLPEAQAEQYLDQLRKHEIVNAAVIGKVTEGAPGNIIVK